MKEQKTEKINLGESNAQGKAVVHEEEEAKSDD